MGIELFITGMQCSKLIDLDAFKKKKMFYCPSPLRIDDLRERHVIFYSDVKHSAN